MKTAKRIFTSLLTVMLMAAMLAVPASAEENASITINNSASGHTYEAYQIFSGDLDGGILSDIAWGSGIDASWYDAESQEFGKDGETTVFDGYTAEAVAATLSTEAHAREFAEAIAPYLSATPTKTVDEQTGSSKYVLEDLDPGYYLIKDMDNTQDGDHDSYTRYMIQLLGSVEIDPKGAVPTLSKGVVKTADSKFENYKEAISASIGDTVYYALTASMHSNINDYEDCYYRIEDKMPASLTFDAAEDFLGVYVVNGSLQKEIDTQHYTVDFNAATHTLTVTFKDIHEAIHAATEATTAVADKIVVSYQATLNSDAIVGQDDDGNGLLDPNQNFAVLYYSNNPNEDYDAETDIDGVPDDLGKTAEAQADVYSYILKLYKIDSAKDQEGKDIPLKNAQFKLHILENGTTERYMNFDENGKFEGYAASKDAADTLTTGDDGYITVQGLASGTYHFEEIAAPAGYNTLDNEVKVTFTGELNQATGEFAGFTASQTGGNTVSADKALGTATVTVVNTKGATLPSTGGMGTTMFYIAGAALMVGAATILVSKKRGVQK